MIKFETKCKLAAISGVLGILFFSMACSKRGQAADQKIKLTMPRIRENTELSLGSVISPEAFLEKNPEYNPSWVTKLRMSGKDASDLAKELNKKTPYPLERRNSLSEQVAWWHPTKTSSKYQYMTSFNSPVLVVLSEENENTIVYIEWSSP